MGVRARVVSTLAKIIQGAGDEESTYLTGAAGTSCHVNKLWAAPALACPAGGLYSESILAAL